MKYFIKIIFVVCFLLSQEKNSVELTSVMLTADTFFSEENEILYKVQDGDNLWKIAEKYKTTPKEILEEIVKIKEQNSSSINSNNERIYPNQNLKITIPEDNQTLSIFSQFSSTSMSDNTIYRSSESNIERIASSNYTLNDIFKSVVIIFSQNSKKNLRKSGTGVIVNQKGDILTSNHIVDDASDIFVVFFENGFENKLIKDVRSKAKKAKILKSSYDKDLALLSISNFEGLDINPVKFSNVHQIKPAERIFSLGHPGGWIYSYSDGIIKKIIENFSTDDFPGFKADVISTSTDSEMGDSGGPLFNNRGELIGITFSATSLSSKTSLAIAINEINNFLR